MTYLAILNTNNPTTTAVLSGKNKREATTQRNILMTVPILILLLCFGASHYYLIPTPIPVKEPLVVVCEERDVPIPLTEPTAPLDPYYDEPNPLLYNITSRNKLFYNLEHQNIGGSFVVKMSTIIHNILLCRSNRMLNLKYTRMLDEDEEWTKLGRINEDHVRGFTRDGYQNSTEYEKLNFNVGTFAPLPTSKFAKGFGNETLIEKLRLDLTPELANLTPQNLAIMSPDEQSRVANLVYGIVANSLYTFKTEQHVINFTFPTKNNLSPYDRAVAEMRRMNTYILLGAIPNYVDEV